MYKNLKPLELKPKNSLDNLVKDENRNNPILINEKKSKNWCCGCGCGCGCLTSILGISSAYALYRIFLN